MKNLFSSLKDLLSYIVLVVVGLLVVLGVVFGIVKKTQGSLVAYAFDYDYYEQRNFDLNSRSFRHFLQDQSVVINDFSEYRFDGRFYLGYQLSMDDGSSYETYKISGEFNYEYYVMIVRYVGEGDELYFNNGFYSEIYTESLRYDIVPRVSPTSTNWSFFPLVLPDFGKLFATITAYDFLSHGAYTVIKHNDGALSNFSYMVADFDIPNNYAGGNYFYSITNSTFHTHFVLDFIGISDVNELQRFLHIAASQGGTGGGGEYSNGYHDGYIDGYHDGISENEYYQSFYDSGYEFGYHVGYEEGSTSGYEQGFAEGQSGGSTWLVGLLDGVSAVLNIQFLPGITFATVVFVPIVFALFWWLIKLLRGGE